MAKTLIKRKELECHWNCTFFVHIEFLTPNISDVGDEQDKRFNQDISHLMSQKREKQFE